MIKLRSQLMAIRSVVSTVDLKLNRIQAVVTTRVFNGTVVTIERGSHQKSGLAAYNSYRWTFSPDGSRLHLAHLRFGPQHPVELVSFDLTAPIERDDNSTEYRALAPHRCKEDLYDAALRLEPLGEIVLTWRITGPRKDQTIVTRYSPEPAGSHVVKM